MAYDRDEVLRQVQLDELCDELLGPRKGQGRSGSWSCPSPNHGPQTGRTPPLSVFRSRAGEQRWRCHGCGAGGTALDLVMVLQEVDFKGAIDALARRTGVAPSAAALRPASRPRAKPTAPVTVQPHSAIEAHVARCESILATPAGDPVQRWLAGRGLSEDILAANRVGADPGPRALPRRKGLPRGGPGAVFPVLERGTAVYLQLRYLCPRNHRYEGPSSALAPMPRLAVPRLTRAARRPEVLLITEGVADALTAADAGYQAVAVLSSSLVNESVASAIVHRWPTHELVLAFDADRAGSQGSDQLQALLSAHGGRSHTAVLALPPGAGDLNAWRQASGGRFQDELALRLELPRLGGQRLGDTRTEGGAPEVLRTSDAIHKIGGPSLGF
jgi:hypothetical protein